MKLQDQVVSLELSKQLKEAGYRQEGLWWWQLTGFPIEEYYNGKLTNNPNNETLRAIIAPTVAELGEALPDTFVSGQLDIKSNKPHTFACYGWSQIPQQEADTEANARAKMWLYLKKERKKSG